jgi:hypothetical protein
MHGVGPRRVRRSCHVSAHAPCAPVHQPCALRTADIAAVVDIAAQTTAAAPAPRYIFGPPGPGGSGWANRGRLCYPACFLRASGHPPGQHSIIIVLRPWPWCWCGPHAARRARARLPAGQAARSQNTEDGSPKIA